MKSLKYPKLKLKKFQKTPWKIQEETSFFMKGKTTIHTHTDTQTHRHTDTHTNTHTHTHTHIHIHTLFV